MVNFQRNDRVELVRTTDEHTRLQPGDRGTVTRVDHSMKVVGMRWDDGSSLSMLLDEGDEIRLLERPTS
ncbi:DUF4314 domain-containing protein (plasmid) [Streptosporangium sp. CA-135522]|uniref:DUF4314 domain-containing protein n=1 Tax=Streptosporangium sp. CA-135522 TaxID=3240072 RepID=UPI003D8AC3E5